MPASTEFQVKLTPAIVLPDPSRASAVYWAVAPTETRAESGVTTTLAIVGGPVPSSPLQALRKSPVVRRSELHRVPKCKIIVGLPRWRRKLATKLVARVVGRW
jgi:hypothetical protein